jgi:cytoskeletal protein RodZ
MTNDKDFQQSNDLKSIGSILKKKREELSYTLEHVSEITRITLTSLKNIEEGNMQALPGLVFVRGFVRNYAKLLGLESDWMVEGLNLSFAAGNDASPPAKESFMNKADRSLPKSTVFYYSMGIAIVFAVLLLIYVMYSKPSNQLTLNNESVETVQAVAAPEEQTIASQQALGVSSPGSEASGQGQQPVAPIISPLTLTLVGLENEWIRLSVDDKAPFELKLKKGEKYEWPGEEEYSLVMTTGKTATVHLNGEEIVDRGSDPNQIYQVKLNKFTLKQINNR